MIWFPTYTEYPNRLRIDQGSVFSSNRWKHLTDLNRVQLIVSGVEVHSLLRIGEQYHEPLRKIYRKIKFIHPTVPSAYLLKIAVKAVNGTMEENGLVPSRLFFGVLFRFPILNLTLPEQREHLEEIKTARSEMNAIVAERRMFGALTPNILPSADRFYKVGEEILANSESKKE